MLPSRIFFDNFLDDIEPRKLDKMMKCDVYEEGNMYHIEMDAPGFKKEDIKIDIDNGYLTISAEHKEKNDEKDGKKYIRRERHYSKFTRSFYLGNADEEKIDASYKDGTLYIEINKKDESQDKKHIEIK